jgi:hypothetical protein
MKMYGRVGPLSLGTRQLHAMAALFLVPTGQETEQDKQLA